MKKNTLKNRLICLFTCLILCSLGVLQSLAQPSFSTQIDFRLFDQYGELVDLERFSQEFSIEDIFCNTVDLEPPHSPLRYDGDYFNYTVSTIGPRYSFALRYQKTLMVIFLPFTQEGKPYYRLDIPFQEGDFLLDFSARQKRRSSTSVFRIKKINWEHLKEKFASSEYTGDTSCYRKNWNPFN